ncbi:lebercilin-like protein [Colossoma macropomum]|uniref:lebercilin-like protein n=1 Tax=Colossoma macropomum TaxID=42526 RepID=UPI001863D03E|nr:lebercilin-like protein [Colossoma macropomum]
MSVRHHGQKEEPQSARCTEDEEQEPCGQDEELQDSHTEIHSPSDKSSCSRTELRFSSRIRSKKSSDRSSSSPSSEEEDESSAVLPPPSPSATRKKLKRPKGQNKSGHFYQRNRTRRVPLLPPIRLRPLDFPRQCIASAQQQRIKQLSSQVRDLQQQLSTASQENRLLRRLHGRHTVALQRLQDMEASLPQMLRQHSGEARALQELLRSARSRNSTLSRRLRDAEAELLNTCDALRRLQQLSQDQSLEERETLTQRLSTLSTSLQIQNHRIQDLEKNLALSNTSFNRQLSAERRKTAEARELARHLEEEIKSLTQKLKEREKELEIHNIYSLRFLKGRKRGTKESKSVQTVSVSPSPAEVPTRPLQIEYLPEERPPAEPQNQLNSWEFYAGDCADSFKREAEEEEEEEVENEGEETIESRTTGESRHTADSTALTTQTVMITDGSDGGTDGPKLDINTEQEEVTATPSQSSPLPSEQHSSADQSFQRSVVTPSPSANKSPMKIRRHYVFKEAILNLHCGKPAYEHRHHKGQSSPALLDAGAYEPSFVPAAPNNTRSSSLVKELFGQGHMVEQKPDVKGDVGPKSSEQN